MLVNYCTQKSTIIIIRYYLHCPIQINFKQIDFTPCVEEFGTDNVSDCVAAMIFRIADGTAIAATMQTCSTWQKF